MSTPFLAWSYSRYKQFMDCPKQLWHAVAPKGNPDRIEFVQTPAMLAGIEIDNALTARISKGEPLPAKFAPFEELMAGIIAAPGHKLTQVQLALDESLKQCGYKDWNAAWVRAILDLLIIDGDRAWAWDWKNGQIWLDEAQLRLFAIVVFHCFPEVQTVDTSYVWLKHGKTSDKTYHRRELPDLWMTFLPDVERMQVAHRTGHWPAQPARGAASCSHCMVNAAGKCSVALVKYKTK